MFLFGEHKEREDEIEIIRMYLHTFVEFAKNIFKFEDLCGPGKIIHSLIAGEFVEKFFMDEIIEPKELK